MRRRGAIGIAPVSHLADIASKHNEQARWPFTRGMLEILARFVRALSSFPSQCASVARALVVEEMNAMAQLYRRRCGRLATTSKIDALPAASGGRIIKPARRPRQSRGP
jgi:hypothetical protein